MQHIEFIRSHDNKFPRGFTIVELLIVIVVIGILAALIIIAYTGIQQRAIETSMKSDLRNATSQIQSDQTINGSYPTSAAASNNGQGLKASGNNQISYVSYGSGFCISVSNAGSATPFHYKSSSGVIETGLCGAIVATVAGSGVAGYADGLGTAAQFNQPYDAVFDVLGNLYVADETNHRIRMISPTGAVTTIAGSGTPGFANGTGTAAQFNRPKGIAIDNAGDLIVADRSNHRIRKVTPAGVVTTIAGSGTAGSLNATGTAAQFNFPVSVAVDDTGNIFVADNNNNLIRVISSGNVVSTFAGSTSGTADGTGTAAQFWSPTGVAVDNSNNIYVADYGNCLIRRITPAGVVTTLAGSGAYAETDGTGTAAAFRSPMDLVAASNGDIYVVDEDYGRVRRVTQAGVVTTIAGTTYGYVDGPGATAQFRYPSGITIDDDDNLYLADRSSHRIRKITQ